MKGFYIDVHNYSKPSVEDDEANYFAAALLMPERQFLVALNDFGIENTAKYFGVAVPHVEYRMKCLGIVRN